MVMKLKGSIEQGLSKVPKICEGVDCKRQVMTLDLPKWPIKFVQKDYLLNLPTWTMEFNQGLQLPNLS